MNNLFEKVWQNRRIIFLVVIIFLLGMTIRAHLMRYDGNYLFEPDAYYHARITEQLVKYGEVLNPDPFSYYQLGGATPMNLSFYWIVSSIIYLLISFGGAYSKDLLLWSIKFLPCIYGALISVSMYFLAKEVFNNKKVGLIAAFLTAVTPAFVYRTMAGAQGDNSLGFLWMVIGFYFFVKAMKTHSLHKKDIINALLAGLFFGIMAFSWQMSLLIPMIAIPYFIFALAFIAYNSHKESLTKSEVTFFSVKFFIIMIFYTIISYAVKRDWITDMLNWLGGAISISPEMTGIILIAAALGSFIVAYFVSQMNHEMKKLFFTLAIIGLYAGFAFMAFLFFTEPDLFYRNGGREAVTSMVGEESVGNSFFGTKYNALIVFPWVGLLLLPVGLYFFNKKDSHSQIIFWFWTIITLFMAWYKLKFTFVFGLGIVTGAAITAYLILETLKHFNLEKGLEAKASLVCLFFIIALGVGASGIFVPDYTPHANSSPNWISTMNWIKINTPQDAKLFNWWNEGHMISFITGRKVSSDNRNFAMRANQGFAEFVIETDTDKAYNVVAKEFGADYIIISSDMFYSMVSFEYYYANKVVPEKGAKYSEAPTRLMGCSDLNTIISCEGNNIPKEQYDSFSKTWKSLPDEFYNGEKPLFFYADNSQLVVLNQAINNTNLAKVWLNSEETSKYYEEVYATPSIKIFKVLK